MKKLNSIPKINTGHLITWYVCRVLLFLWGIYGVLHGYNFELVQACFAILFTHLWDFFQLFGGKSFITRCPYSLQTILNVFICFSCVVGTTVNQLTTFEYIDIPEHIFAGFLACSAGFFFGEVMQGKEHKIKIAILSLFSFCFAMMLLCGWEVYEFIMDRIYGFVMQKGQLLFSAGLTDTMEDLILGAIGALVAMLYGAFKRAGLVGKNKAEVRAQYQKERNEYKKKKEFLLSQGRGDEL